jgi:hypothetical protein
MPLAYLVPNHSPVVTLLLLLLLLLLVLDNLL